MAPSIDTPLHALLPFAHVDHLHPDWGIALAAAANGKQKMEEFNQRFHHHLVWLPWQRPGFDLALRLREAVDANPGCDGIILGGHGIFTWGETARQCYLNSLTMIDDLGVFVGEHQQRRGEGLFGGGRFLRRKDSREVATEILPYLRGKLATSRRAIAHYNDSEEVLQFVNSRDAEALAHLGTSCPDHFVRTRIRPLYIHWNPESESLAKLKDYIAEGAEKYRQEYAAYYHRFATKDSPALRDANPSVVLVPGVGMFTFGKNKTEARITGEFYVNAIHVMARGDSAGRRRSASYAAAAGAQARGLGGILEPRQLRCPAAGGGFSHRILGAGGGQAAPPTAGKRIQPEDFSGGGRWERHRAGHRFAPAGWAAHTSWWPIATRSAAAESAAHAAPSAKESVASCKMDLGERASIAAAIHETVLRFGGLDGIINTAAIFIPPDSRGRLTDENWRRTFDINISGNYMLVDEGRSHLLAQGLPAVVVLTSSANAVVPKWGSEAYDISKSAVSHLVRELAVGLAPLVRVNGVSPATVVEGSTMFPRERVIVSLKKFHVAFSEEESTEDLRSKLANFYAHRTLTKLSVTPQDCAEAICWLASDRAAKTTGHLIPVDGGLVEAFLR